MRRNRFDAIHEINKKFKLLDTEFDNRTLFIKNGNNHKSKKYEMKSAKALYMKALNSFEQSNENPAYSIPLNTFRWEDILKRYIRRYYYALAHPYDITSNGACRDVANWVIVQAKCLDKLAKYQECMRKPNLDFQSISIKSEDRGYQFFHRTKPRKEDLRDNFKHCSEELFRTVSNACILLMGNPEKKEELEKLLNTVDCIIAFQKNPTNPERLLELIEELKNDKSFMNCYDSIEAHEIKKKLQPMIAIGLFIVGIIFLPSLPFAWGAAYQLYHPTTVTRTKDAVVKLLDSAYKVAEEATQQQRGPDDEKGLSSRMS